MNGVARASLADLAAVRVKLPRALSVRAAVQDHRFFRAKALAER